MKPILDISSKSSFTVWESCVWRDAFSSSVLVADHETNKMQVIFDKDPTRSSTHALFYANTGNILAGCFISKGKRPREMDIVRVELMRMENLITKQVQGHTVPEAKLSPVYLSSIAMRVEYDVEPKFDQLLGAYEDRPSLPHGRQLMENAIRKAMTSPDKQKLFWGIPRQRVEEE